MKCFSALLRAENSEKAGWSCWTLTRTMEVSVLFCEPKIRKNRNAPRRRNNDSAFQCSSASRKFGKNSSQIIFPRQKIGFSALLRAENSENDWRKRREDGSVSFSALLRAENSEKPTLQPLSTSSTRRFSALLRAENSEKACLDRSDAKGRRFSALLRAENSEKTVTPVRQSPEFSCFSALLRAENSEN